MNKRHVNALATALLCCLVVALSVVTGVAQGTPTIINRWVISDGGAPSSDGNVTVNDTLGEPIIGPSSGSNVWLGAGYWGAGAVEQGPPPPPPIPVGGYVMPVNKLGLLAPWIGLAALVGLLLAGTVVVFRRQKRR
jgi:hypothetical protein